MPLPAFFGTQITAAVQEYALGSFFVAPVQLICANGSGLCAPHGTDTACIQPRAKYLGLARTIYIRCIYGISGRVITKYTVIYGVYIRFWPTLNISSMQMIDPCVLHGTDTACIQPRAAQLTTDITQTIDPCVLHGAADYTQPPATNHTQMIYPCVLHGAADYVQPPAAATAAATRQTGPEEKATEGRYKWGKVLSVLCEQGGAVCVCVCAV
jgi:hypothetical protein